MKKYILKRNLPFAKAGCEVEFSLNIDEHPQIRIGIDDKEKIIVYFHCELKDLGSLLLGGWIEEREVFEDKGYCIKCGEKCDYC